jgi:hypothetical protein
MFVLFAIKYLKLLNLIKNILLNFNLRTSNKYGSVTALKQCPTKHLSPRGGGASNQAQRITGQTFFL